MAMLQIVMLMADLEEEIGAGKYIDSAGATQAATALAQGMASAAASASAASNGVLIGDGSTQASRSAVGTSQQSAGTATTPVYVPRATPKSRREGSATAMSAPLLRRKRVPSGTMPPHRDTVRAVLSGNSIAEAGGELVQMGR